MKNKRFLFNLYPFWSPAILFRVILGKIKHLTNNANAQYVPKRNEKRVFEIETKNGENRGVKFAPRDIFHKTPI